MILGITGYIGSGKTTVARLFQDKGYEVVDVDGISHELLKEQEIRTKITGEFGESVIDRQLNIDRKKLSEIVFKDEEKLKRLNKIVHKKLMEVTKKRIMMLKEEKRNVVVDVALLQELELTELCDKIIVVNTSLEKLYVRLVSRYTPKQILLIMNNQKIPSETDFIIENNGTMEQLQSRVGNVMKELR